MAAQIFNRIGQLGFGLAIAGGVVNSALYNVDGGHRAVMFDRFRGILPAVTGKFYTIHNYTLLLLEDFLLPKVPKIFISELN